MKNIQNLGGFVLTSKPYSKDAGNVLKQDENITSPGDHYAASTILKYDYCLPPGEPQVKQQARKKMFLMKDKSNAA